ncbi:hypothetical protein [Rhodopseudomonas pseudopalustris]|uniref:hypothetical protein n=1 Tax=Rhodopseudomonas pseudopalustris TaxID=1513892 RepID=UPI0011145A4F|nr:hypothetical protein [Rhodopseudomonas pseudopalustris]
MKSFSTAPAAWLLLTIGAAAGDPPVSAEKAMMQVDAVLQAQRPATPDAKTEPAAPPDFRATLNDIRNAERLVMAAFKTGDDGELTVQSRRLFQIESRLLQATKPGDVRAACWMGGRRSLRYCVGDQARCEKRKPRQVAGGSRDARTILSPQSDGLRARDRLQQRRQPVKRQT